MSRYTEFQEERSEQESLLNEQETEQLICIKNLIAQPNPLMNKIEYAPYDAKNHYPAPMTKLPPMLSNHHYHIDNVNMLLMDEAAFVHQKMKKDLAKCWGMRANHQGQELLTLREFYAGKALIYQKYVTSTTSNYFATFNLNLNSAKDAEKHSKNAFIIRNNRTPPLLSDRCRTERLSLANRPKIDFNSNFQSGNLYKVYQRQYNEYDLILQNDINTKGNNQWFFFSVKSVPKGTSVRFNLVNMVKRFSLFDYGMKPSVFSMMRYEKRGVGWVRDGTKVNYHQSQELRRQSNEYPYFTLSFDYKFNYDGDIVYFAYSIPYTFNNLSTFLSSTLADRNHHKKVRVRSLGETLGGNAVNLFELTNSQSRNEKKSIWIMGRQHSGEVTSSFMVEGIMNFLLSDSPEASYLMDNYLFRVVPMLNIDGVVHGNSRADLSGYDPNRKWSDPSKIYQPILYNIKKIIEKDSVEMILDLHSHSRKLGTFFYCNSSPHYSNTIKIFPMLVCKNDERFDYKSNRFRGGNNTTARRVFYDILNIPYVYTIESSLFGYQKEGDFRITAYQPDDYRQMGQNVLKTFAQMMSKKSSLKSKDERLLLCSKEELESDNNIWDMMNEADEVESLGSDQDPAADELSKKELDGIFQRKQKKPRKKKKESKPQKKEKEEPKQVEQVVIRIKKNDKESIYKKFFSGRSSLQRATTVFQMAKPPKETSSFGCQVNIQEKAILHRASLNSQPIKEKTFDKIFEKKSLCIFGQKVEDDLVIFGNTVGLQTDAEKSFFRNRNQIQLENKSTNKRVLKSNPKVSTISLHNENNFLNKGDLLHKAMRMLNTRL